MPTELSSPPTLFISRPVHRTLTKRVVKLICSAFLSLLLAACVLLFVLWLALRPHRPRFHVSSFSVTGLSANGSAPLTFSFEVAVRNPNQEIAVSYDSVFVSVYYRDDRVGAAEAPAAGPFFQPPKNTTVISGKAAGVAPAAAAGTVAREARAGSVVFRLELASVVRFRMSTWDTHRHHLHVSCDVEVGPDGLITVRSKDKRCYIYFL
ncbi:hypothetical protein C4D60_Mb11t16400 [Musa balbisiana]|uniref:Late embryogenesis abundant protein LEA-2 subgroup domain-containing protein n=1 Tax=Musa balbisiana TaxID=52838 RepID=A0A4S8J4Q1_MUSBA|nr:hypothetical protein C4D60_Mb11t16400 [Musa balbisiana]